MTEQHDLRLGGSVTPLAPRRVAAQTTFTRLELNILLQVYGVGVASGEWRDYAIDFSADCAIFSIFRRSAERAHFTIEKRPALALRQGAFAVRDQKGAIQRRGHDLARVLLCLRRVRQLK